jgi:hypothetical protein
LGSLEGRGREGLGFRAQSGSRARGGDRGRGHDRSSRSLLREDERRLVTSGEGCLLIRVRGMRVMLGSWVAIVVVEMCMLTSPVYGSYVVVSTRVYVIQYEQKTYDSEQYSRLKLGVTICLSQVALRVDQHRVSQ